MKPMYLILVATGVAQADEETTPHLACVTGRRTGPSHCNVLPVDMEHTLWIIYSRRDTNTLDMTPKMAVEGKRCGYYLGDEIEETFQSA